jgi:hypothetical protein
MRKHLQPHNRVDFGDAMKLHLRVLKIEGKDIHIVTLRPETKAVFWVEYRHPIWRMYIEQDEGNLLARLLWGLSYQKHPNTMILLDRLHIQDMSPDVPPVTSPPLLILPTNLTSVNNSILSELKAKNIQNSPTKTIRWHTFGLDKSLDENAKVEEIYGMKLYEQEKMFPCQGFVCYTARPPILRQNAKFLYDVHIDPQHGVAYWEMERPDNNKDISGEVAIYKDYEKAKESSATMHYNREMFN